MTSLLPVFAIGKRRGRADDFLGGQQFCNSHRPARISLPVGLIVSLSMGITVVQARGLDAYLPVVGPAPLRYQPATAKPTAFAPDWFAPKKETPSKQTNAPEPAIKPASQVEAKTNAEAVVKAVSPSPTQVTNTPAPSATIISAESVPSAASNETDIKNEVVSPSSTVDSLMVTPQMLAEFMKPAPGQTNQPATSVLLPTQLRFLPPQSRPGESRAIYRSP